MLVNMSPSSVIPRAPPRASRTLCIRRLRVTPGTSSSPATRILAVSWLTYSSTRAATSANSSDRKAHATHFASVLAVLARQRLASMEKPEAWCSKLRPPALSLRLFGCITLYLGSASLEGKLLEKSCSRSQENA